MQEIEAEFIPEDQAKDAFLAHCSFSNAVCVRQLWRGTLRVGKGATMTYNETHFHRDRGGIEVLPAMGAEMAVKCEFCSEFRLSQEATDRVEIDYKVRVENDGLCELYVKIYGNLDDRIHVKESTYLDDIGARGLVKSRIVVSERAESKVADEIVGNAPLLRGHADCVEIIQGKQARAGALPVQLMMDETAKLIY